MAIVDVSIVTWNSARVISALLDSLQKQSLMPAHIFIVDNASIDNTREICNRYPETTFILQKTNIGFAAGHNVAIKKSTADFTLVVNPDVVLDPKYIEALFNYANVKPKCASFVGTVFKNSPENLVDTTGLQIKTWRITRERTAKDLQPHEVFGISGAVAFYRKTALEDIKVNEQYFNELYFAYKEDVELAWRLRWAGWSAAYVPAAQAQHSRTISLHTALTKRGVRQRELSYRNHLLLYASVENIQTLFFDLWAIIPAELLRFLLLLFGDARVTLHALAEVRKMWHSARTFAKGTARRVPARTLRVAFWL
jgi:GT2 family glycosyltransferase